MNLTNVVLLTCCFAAIAPAWHDPVHQRITRAALRSLPPGMQQAWAAESEALIARYCLYPDTFAGSKGEDRRRLAAFCTRPDGFVIHNVTWKRNEDLASLEFTLNAIVEGLRAGDAAKSAQHAGVLAHLLGDSTCPAHALMPADVQLNSLRELIPPPPGKQDLKLHTIIERSSPEFDLDGRAPAQAGDSVAHAAAALLDRCYARIKTNRGQLIDMVRAIYRDDQAALDAERLETAHAGAELLADAFLTVFRLAGVGQ